jgi:hypothetical protein
MTEYQASNNFMKELLSSCLLWYCQEQQYFQLAALVFQPFGEIDAVYFVTIIWLGIEQIVLLDFVHRLVSQENWVTNCHLGFFPGF